MTKLSPCGRHASTPLRMTNLASLANPSKGGIFGTTLGHLLATTNADAKSPFRGDNVFAVLVLSPRPKLERNSTYVGNHL
ncbi:MAG: hypothetical protein ACE5K8_05935 [Candidatus Zixiibacteriota bacterium]